MTADADYETIILCGRCDHPANLTYAELRARQLVWTTKDHTGTYEGDWTFGVCPVCNETVFVQSDHGIIDFGVDPLPST